MTNVRAHRTCDAADSVRSDYEALRAIHGRDGGLPVPVRRELLKSLRRALVTRHDEIAQAIDADFGGRCRHESLLAEIVVVVRAIQHARRHVRRWARRRPVPVGVPFWPSRAWIVPQPLGVVGIMAPWNYPVQLTLSPLVSALAAGNRVMLKPSEKTPRTAEIVSELVGAALGGDVARTVLGGLEAAESFATLPLDHLLFTGSGDAGRRVLHAAADNLTPVTLELGGKCPAVILPDADLVVAARAIVTGKSLNAGQTCVAPDTVLLVGIDAPKFRRAMAEVYGRYCMDGAVTAVASESQWQRLERLAGRAALDQLGPDEVEARYRPLALAFDPEPNSPLLEQEIFGPILPVVGLASLDEALAWIAARPSPLALYLFTRDRNAERRVLEATASGSLVVNGTVVQAAIEALPFGGVGASGSGRYHGRAGFDTFSNPRAVVRQARWTLSRLTDPPYGPKTEHIIQWILGRP